MKTVWKREFVQPAMTIVGLRCSRAMLLQTSATRENYGNVIEENWQ